MNKIEYKNRYGDLFTFTKTEDGNILWEGNFGYGRIGYPNMYDKAYTQYIEDGGSLELEKFKKQVHEAVYDDNGKYLGMSELAQIYGKLVYSDRTTIDMVDPSGGPYLCAGFDMEYLNEEFEGLVVQKFEPINGSYKIIIKK
jgi:hypothetical protein